MTRIVVLLAALLGATSVGAEDLARPPAFFAISVPDLGSAVKWYSETLGLTPTMFPPSPQARAAVLRGQGLVVELVEHSQSFPLEKRIAKLEGRYLVQGLFKVGFFVQDLDGVMARLKQKSVRFKGAVFTDEAAGLRSVLLLDNNENIIQLFGSIERQ